MMIRRLKTIARAVLPTPVFNGLKGLQRKINFAKASGFSDEERLINRYLESLPMAERYCVDIAAQDGVAGSQTLNLFKQGWAGLAVEYDPRMFAILADAYSAFADVSLVRTRVVPENATAILKAALCPKHFGFLSLDIDSYDHFVLDQILSEFRPALICVEINEVVPPPLEFTVTYNPDHLWEGDHFQGQSIAKCYTLCVAHRYDIVQLHYNNLFLMPSELNTHQALLPEQAYEKGYKNQSDRQIKFPWNADMEEVLSMEPSEALKFLNSKFAKYRGKYTLE